VEQINDRGEMFGIGTLTDGNDRALFLIPCDENHPNMASTRGSPPGTCPIQSCGRQQAAVL
jgi:hypothetical protein